MPQTWLIVPGTDTSQGGIAAYDSEANQIGPTYQSLPGGATDWVVGQGAIYNVNDPFNPIRFNPDIPSFLTVSESGAFQVQVGTGYGNINRGTSTNLQYGIAGSINYTTSEGEEASLSIQFAALNRTGYRWAIREDENGNPVQVRVPADQTLTALNSQYPGYLRWARPDEVIGPALTWHIFNLSRSSDPADRDAYAQLMRDMGIDPENPPADVSEQVAAWLQINSSNFTAASRYSFNNQGDRI